MYYYDMRVLDIFTALGAVRLNDHFVYVSGRHGAAYVNKDAIYPDTKATSALCLRLATVFVKADVEVVVAPAIGGTILSQWVASYLNSWSASGKNVLAVYAEKSSDGGFALRRGYDTLVAGKRVLVVEDVLTTGGSVKKVVDAVRAASGTVVGVSALVNRGGVTAQALDVPRLHTLLDMSFETWDVDECPLCAIGVPVNVECGHGAAFLAAHPLYPRVAQAHVVPDEVPAKKSPEE